MRNKKVRSLTTALVVVSFTTAIFGFLAKYENDKFQNQESLAQEYQQELNANTRQVYIATADISKGDRILTQEMADAINSQASLDDVQDEETAGAVLSSEVKANVELATIYSSAAQESFLTLDEDQIGYYAITDIAAQQPVSTNMVNDLEITQDTREFEITAADLMVDQKEGEAVDVRIVYPNGEDYVVLSKKHIRNLSLKNSTWFTHMTEDEILRFQSAVVDAYTITGARLYTTRYVQDNLQDAADVTYVVRSSTMDVINSDPNIYEKAANELNAGARLSLETRLGNLTEEQLAAVSTGFGLTDTASGAVLQENVETYREQIDALGLDDDDAKEEVSEEETEDGLSEDYSSVVAE